MKLTKETIAVLQNFASINSGVILREGKRQTTCSPGKSVFVYADVEEEFPHQFAIYDLPQFLKVLSIFEEPELEFIEDQNCVVVSQGSSRFTFMGTNPDMVKHTLKPFPMPSDVESIDLDIQQPLLEKILGISNSLGLPNICIQAENGVQKVIVTHIQEKSSNNFEFVIDEDYEGEDHNLVFSSTNLGMVKGDYTVSIVRIKKALVAHWKNKSEPLEYFVALDVANSQSDL